MNNLNHIKNNVSEFDTVELFSVYLEGYILTPIGILGIIGKLIRYAAIHYCFLIQFFLIRMMYDQYNKIHFNLGNVLSIAVLASKDLRNGFSDLLITLSTFDTIYLLMAILIHGAPKLNEHYNYNVLPILMPIW